MLAQIPAAEDEPAWRTSMFDRITFDSKISAAVRQFVPVSVIVGQIAHGATQDEVLRESRTSNGKMSNRRSPTRRG